VKHPAHHARTNPDKIAYRMTGSGALLTYADLDRRSNQGAQAFRSLGVRQGDHIAIMMENRLEFMAICWAAQRAGLIYTAVSRYLSADEAAYIVDDCDAKIFITSDVATDRAGDLLARIGGSVRAFMVGSPARGFASWDALTGSMPDTSIADEAAGMDMLYSSGTTGRPKGITRTFVAQPIDTLVPLLVLLCEQMAGMGPQSIYLSPAPIYHAAPLRFLMMSASLGGTALIMESFDAEAFLAHVETDRVTHTQLVPTMFVRMLKLPDAVRSGYDTSSLVAAVHAAAPCPVEVKQRMIDWWGPILIEYYAGTEANGVTLCTSQEWLDHPGTVGRSLAGEARILDPAGNELPAGDVGSVYFDSGLSFTYHNDPGKTRKAFVRPGCSTLGDVGYLDADGYLYLTDRASYTIISGGVNIYPQETEDALISHPAVADVAVFGVPNEDLGEEVKAVVQPEPHAVAGPELEAELIAWCRSRLSRIKTPKSIDFRARLPRTATGKLIKRHLKDEYEKAFRASQSQADR
jgi:acyl-CoA synthetase (AMP-forming)/AMP-acid ligase II